MRTSIYPAVLLCLVTMVNATHSQSLPVKRIVIRADTILDGKGNTLKNTRIVVEGDKIVAIDPKAGPID